MDAMSARQILVIKHYDEGEIPSVPLKKIVFSSVPLEKFFFLIYPHLSFSFTCVPLSSRKNTLKVIFIKDVSQNNFLKIITHKRELLIFFRIL
jgi:hypothetical protein